MAISTASSWPKVELSEHVDLLTGFPFKSSQYTDGTDDVRLLRGDNVGQGSLRWNGVKRWRQSDFDRFAEFQLKLDDVILAMDRPWITAGLKYAWVTKRDLPALLVQRVARMRGSNGLLTNYLRYVIGSRGFIDHVISITTGINVPHISARDIKAYRFRLPPFHAQRRIASILSAYDDLIENNARRIAILEEMAQRVFDEWFVLRKLPRATMAQFGRMTGQEMPFSAVADFVNGYAFKPTDWGQEGIPIIKIKELKEGVTPQTPRYTGMLPSKYAVADGDLLFSWSADLDAYLWAGGSGWLNQHLFKVVPHPPLTKTILFFWLKHAMHEFRARAAGTTMRHIKRSALDQVMLVVPPDSLITEFDRTVSPMLDEVRVLQTSNRALTYARDLLLPKLISGEIDVSAVDTPKEMEVA